MFLLGINYKKGYIKKSKIAGLCICKIYTYFVGIYKNLRIYIFTVYTMQKTRKASAEARKQQTVAQNISFEAKNRLSVEGIQVDNLVKLSVWREIVDENWEIKPEWVWILGENYKKAKTKIKEWNEQKENLVKNLEKQKVKIKKLDSKLGNVKLYEENLEQVPENLMAIYQNQLYDLAKPDISLEHLASELTFFDFLMRIANGEPVNIHYIPYRNIENLVKICNEYFTVSESPEQEPENSSPMRKSRLFKRLLSSENTPNERNYEKNLIQNLTYKRMLQEMELLDWLLLAELKENLDSMDYLADQYREFIVENWLSVKEQKIELKKYQKARQKMSDRNWHIRYNLRKNYGYLC